MLQGGSGSGSGCGSGRTIKSESIVGRGMGSTHALGMDQRGESKAKRGGGRDDVEERRVVRGPVYINNVFGMGKLEPQAQTR